MAHVHKWKVRGTIYSSRDPRRRDWMLGPASMALRHKALPIKAHAIFWIRNYALGFVAATLSWNLESRCDSRTGARE